MEPTDLLKKTSSGTLKCPKCGSEKMSLQNVRVGMEGGKPKLDPNTKGVCKNCGANFSIEQLQKILSGGGKQWWQFWK